MDFLYRERGAGKRTVKPSKVGILQKCNLDIKKLSLVLFYWPVFHKQSVNVCNIEILLIQDSELLEVLIGEESDDSDFEVEKHKGKLVSWL